MKKNLSLLCVVALILSLAACGASKGDYSNSTLTAQVLSITGTTVQLQLGEMGGRGQGAPNGGEMPDGDLSFPDMPEGAAPDGDGSRPDMPEGEFPGGDGSRPEMPEGEFPGGENGSGTPPSGMGGGRLPFAAGDEIITLDLDGASIKIGLADSQNNGAVSDISVDDILLVEFGDNNTVTSVTVMDMRGLGGQSGSDFGGSGDINQGTTANTIEEDGTYSETIYSSTGDDENALRVVGAAVFSQHIIVRAWLL